MPELEESMVEIGEPTPPSLWRRLRSRRVLVQEESMEPTLQPGDRLLVDLGAFRSRPPSLGELVVFDDPEGSGRWHVKRVARAEVAIPAGSCWLLGDSPERSRDSRQFGPVPASRIRGRAWFRYAPEDRRGPI